MAEAKGAWTVAQPFQALALTGGGFRGLFTAKALALLEAECGEPIGRRFDLLTGTSIGGIVALAIAFEVPMTQQQREWLDRLLQGELPARQTLYNKIKRSAKKASRKHLDLLIGQLNWLESLPDSDMLLEGVAETKLRHMADSAAVLDAGELKDYRPAKRHAMVLSLITPQKLKQWPGRSWRPSTVPLTSQDAR